MYIFSKWINSLEWKEIGYLRETKKDQSLIDQQQFKLILKTLNWLQCVTKWCQNVLKHPEFLHNSSQLYTSYTTLYN